MRRLLFLLPVGLFVGVLAAFAAGRDPALLPSMLIDRPLPAFALLPVRPGDVGLKTTDLTGKPSLLNVYGSWCVSCRVEHPMLMRLKAEGVPIHGVDWKDEPAEGARWLADHGDPYVKTGNDQLGRTAIDLGVTGAPETFVVDAHGRVRYKHVGPISPEQWSRTLKPLMDRLRAES